MERFGLTLRRGISARSIFTFVLAVLITTLLWATIGSQATTHAADTTASWNGASLMYDGDQYISAGKSDGKGSHGIAQDASLYTFAETPTTASSTQKVHIIYFKPGTDPPTATAATYVVYDYNSASKDYSNPSGSVNINVDASTSSTVGSSCAIEGVGWIVCPVMTWLSGGMDFVFGIISSFVEVQPLQTGNTNGSLYSAWNIMRGIANIAFIIVFLIVIYAQLTNVQVSNYGLKKLIPRLIIAAIAVNISYIICAVAIDISNVLGYSIQDMFLNIRDQVLGTAADTQIMSWQSVTGFVISGGTAAAALGIGTATTVMATGGTVAGAAFLLLPALIGLLLAVLVVLLILAARQALITILVIIAPLAIVAYLLPNTEKWFEKWRGLLFTLLIFFPAFSVVFGGSQLAGAIIIYNAKSINTLILGMIVLVAPLVITPLLLKFSGGLIGNIARIANNPNKGIVDRTRNWSKSQAEWHRRRGTSGAKFNGDPGTLRKRNFMRQSARYLEGRKSRLEDRTKNATMGTQTAYENSSLFSNQKYDLSLQTAAFESDKSTTHDAHARHVEHAKITPGSLLYDRAYRAEAGKENLDASQKRTAEHFNTQRLIPNSALNNSMVNLKESETDFESSEKEKATYLTRMKTTRVTNLGIAAERLEAVTSIDEGASSRYTAYVDTLRTSNTSALSVATEYAESSKEHAEAAQSRLQGFLDVKRKDPTSILNQSTIAVEAAKSVAENAKSNLTTYILDQRTQKDGLLRAETILVEGSKATQQIAEERLTKMVTDFKSGKLDPSQLNAGEEVVMERMKSESIILAAEKQAVNNAQYEIQDNIASVMTGQADDEVLTEQMLTIAQGVGGEGGRVRAISQAVSQARGLMSDALKSNVELLKDEARRKNTNIKYYSKEMVERYSANYDTMPDGSLITPDRLKAAWQAQAEEKNIPLFEKERFNPRTDQSMLNEIISLNSGAFKAAGAFAMQDRLDHNIENYSAEELGHIIHIDRISNLANANASGLSGWKMGEIVSMADPDNLKADIGAALLDIQVGEQNGATAEQRKAGTEARGYLEAAYETVRAALTNPDIRDTINDRAGYIRKIEKALARVHGQTPLVADPIQAQVNIDLDAVFDDIDPDPLADDDEIDDPEV